MAVIDVQELTLEVVEVSRDDLLEALDAECWDLLGMSGPDFLQAIREGRQIDNPAAPRLGLLATALIESE